MTGTLTTTYLLYLQWSESNSGTTLLVSDWLICLRSPAWAAQLAAAGAWSSSGCLGSFRIENQRKRWKKSTTKTAEVDLTSSSFVVALKTAATRRCRGATPTATLATPSRRCSVQLSTPTSTLTGLRGAWFSILWGVSVVVDVAAVVVVGAGWALACWCCRRGFRSGWRQFAASRDDSIQDCCGCYSVGFSFRKRPWMGSRRCPGGRWTHRGRSLWSSEAAGSRSGPDFRLAWLI